MTLPVPCSGEPPSRRGVFLLITGIVFVLLFSRNMSRHFDLDEHQFVAPPILLREDGRVPYADYPYFHMPTLVGVYAGTITWSPYKLLAARMFYTLCGMGTIAMLFAMSWRMLGSLPSATRWRISGSLTLIYFCSRLFTYSTGWAWNHDSSVVCALAATMLLQRGLRYGRPGHALPAGFLIGSAIGIRLSFALAVVPFAAGVLFIASPMTWRQRVAGVALGALGVVLSLVPAIVLLLQNPDQFVFGNLGYVALNTLFYAASEPASVRSFEGCLRIFRTFASDPGNAALAVSFVYAAGWRMWKARAWRGPDAGDVLLPLSLLPFLMVGVMGPNPVQYQYPYMLLPFMTLVVVATVAAESSDPAMIRYWMRALAAWAVITAATGLPRWYWPVVRLPAPERWVPVEVHRVGEWIRDNTSPGDRVLTIDPVVPMEAGVKVYPEFAVGRFVHHVGPYMTPDERHRYRMTWAEELDRVLAERPPDAIFVDQRVLFLVPAFQEYAESHGFRRLDCPFGEYILWTRPQSAAAHAGNRRQHPESIGVPAGE